jgi:hypothetical protein
LSDKATPIWLQTLHLSKNTIRNHVNSFNGKIGVNRRAAAVMWARELGFTGAAAGKNHH